MDDLERFFKVNDIPAFDAPVRVDKAKHGRGLFATRDIEPDELLTYYPCHYLKETGIHDLSYALLTQPNSPAPWSDDLQDHHDYAFDIYKTKAHNYSIVADPTRPCVPWLACHFANDCVENVMELRRFSVPKTLARNWIKYDRATLKRQNASMRCKDDVVSLHSIKPIKMNEEVLTSYGFLYWLNRSDQDVKRILEKVDSVLLGHLNSVGANQ